MKYLSSILSGTLTLCLSSFAAYQLSHEYMPCIVLFFVAAIIIVVGFISWREDKIFTSFLFLSASGIIVLSALGIQSINRYKNGKEHWIDFQKSLVTPEFKRIKDLADHNHAPSQYEIARYYFHGGYYDKAKNYAQKAANFGNGGGYQLLQEIYLKGLGCFPDTSQAVSNIIQARRTSRLNFSPIWNPFSDRLLESEQSELHNSLQTHKRLQSINQEVLAVLNPQNPTKALNVIKAHRGELEFLSSFSNIPATEYLYVEQCYRKNPDSLRIKQLAQILYKADHIPTNPMERTVFFGFLNGDNDYSDFPYQEHIRDAYYAFVASVHIDKYRTLLNLDYTKSSDEHLLRDYQLLRAQYEYISQLVNGEKENVEYVLHMAFDNRVYKHYAKRMLENVIKAIQKRELQPGLTEADKTRDLRKAYGIELEISYNWKIE